MIEIQLPFLTKTMNDLRRRHWSYVTKEKNKVFEHMLPQLTPLRKLNTPIHVRILRVSSQLPDHDNMVSGGKYILDALVKYGLLPDDSRDMLSCEYDWVKGKQGAGLMHITIYEPGERRDDI